MTYLLDTDVVIDYLNQKGPAYGFITSILAKERVVISVITLTELRAGWDTETADRSIPAIRSLFRTASVNEAVALYAGEQIKKYSQTGITLSATDCLIAATAILHDFCLVTRNIKDFPMPELDLYQELQSSN